MAKQTMRQAARLAASQACAKRRRERAPAGPAAGEACHRGAATEEREATIAATEQRAGAALQAMITDESLTVSEAVQWCAGAISHPEATRLRHLTARTQQPEWLVLGCRCVQLVHDAKDPSAVGSGTACRYLPTSNTCPGWISGRVGQTSIVHAMIISAVIRRFLRRQPG